MARRFWTRVSPSRDHHGRSVVESVEDSHQGWTDVIGPDQPGRGGVAGHPEEVVPLDQGEPQAAGESGHHLLGRLRTRSAVRVGCKCRSTCRTGQQLPRGASRPCAVAVPWRARHRRVAGPLVGGGESRPVRCVARRHHGPPPGRHPGNGSPWLAQVRSTRRFCPSRTRGSDRRGPRRGWCNSGRRNRPPIAGQVHQHIGAVEVPTDA